MHTTLSFTCADPTIGLNVRKSTPGPEQELVRILANSAEVSFRTKNSHLAIFVEPALEHGFPDAVIAVYDPRRFNNWNKERTMLTTPDLRILQHIYRVRSIDESTLRAQLGAKGTGVSQSLGRLSSANVIHF